MAPSLRRTVRRRLAKLRFLAALGCACAHREPPPLSTWELAGGAVTFRAWGGPRICEAEPRFLLDELAGVNSALKRWLDRVSSDAPAAWPESRIAEAEGWRPTVEELTREHALSLAALPRCDFAASAGFPFVQRRGAELLEAVRARKEQLQRVHATARAVRALEAWARGLDAQRSAARRECPTRSPAPQVFFAWRDEDGVTRWLFCDGASVEQPQGGAPVVLEPEDTRRSRPRFGDAQYLEAVRRYPESRVSAPPSA